jgi:F0F1-type ATP synthase membrane subunit c/vacuolar-type H+-ATPase subunit K
MKRRMTAALALGGTLTLGVAACGGGSASGNQAGNNSSAVAGNNSNSAEGFSASRITIEGSVPKTSASGANQALVELGARARFARANQEGGVDGRQIDFRGAIDNRIDPSQDLSIAKQITLQDKAFAAVPVVSPVLSQGGEFWVQNKIPFFGWGISPEFCNNDVGFGFTGCLVPTNKDNRVSTAEAGLLDKSLGIPNGKGKTVALIAEDDTAGSFGLKTVQAAFVADGWKVTYAKASLPSGSPVTDFTPFAQAILTSNSGHAPDVMFHVTKPPNIVGLSNSLRNSGFKGIQVNAVTYGQSFLASGLSQAALNGEYVYIQYGSFENGSAANKQMLADVKAVAPQQTQLTQDIAIGYYSADLFLHDLQKVGHTLSRKAFLAAANDGSTYQVPDGLGNLSYPKNHVSAVPCGSLVQVQDKAFVNKVSLNCFDAVPLSVLGGS